MALRRYRSGGSGRMASAGGRAPPARRQPRAAGGGADRERRGAQQHVGRNPEPQIGNRNTSLYNCPSAPPSQWPAASPMTRPAEPMISAHLM
jgi:hypothetical protein